MNIRFTSELPPYMNDVPEIVRAFAPYIIIDVKAEEEIKFGVNEDGGKVTAEILSPFGNRKESIFLDGEDRLLYKKLSKRFCKTVLYNFCREITGINLAYGSLTGVRPTKLFYELEEKGEDAEKYLIENFFVEPERAALIKEVVKNQRGVYNRSGEGVDIYVNIPFCPSRCAYCAFISAEIGKVKKYITDYVNAVRAELEGVNEKIARENLRVRSIYVGGGTPTSLSAFDLTEMLSPVKDHGCEFTVEAGRPDSVDKEKFGALKALNVTRVSINPQTFKEKTLELIGRKHTPEDAERAALLAKAYGFILNMDLIAGLPEESAEDFKFSLEKTLSINPENITVHTLSLKRGSVFKNSGAEKSVSGITKECVDFARERLISEGFRPYYMYRQKNMADNLENVGYAREGIYCVYNVDYMEETNTVFAAGAGAAGKTVDRARNLITREYRPKGIEEYLRREQKLAAEADRMI